ncbi:MAG TPA: DUF507 family protein [Polyangiaceae bacterium]|jgi:hypothetical protein|nr:DUF507 family protein [Polyangiaceae bacterium]
MWLHRAKIPQIAAEMVRALKDSGDIECESPREVQGDLEAVLSQYVSDDQEINDRARDLVAARGLPNSELTRMKKLVAEQKHVKIGDDAIDYLLDQLIEILMHSNNVDEVFAEDHVLRVRMREPLRKQFAAEEQLEQEVRGRLKNLQEGTAVWEVEYRRLMDDIKRRKG